MKTFVLAALVLACSCRTQPLDPIPTSGEVADLATVSSCTPPCAPAPKACADAKDQASCLTSAACKAILLCGENRFLGCDELDAPMPMFGPFCVRTRCGEHADAPACDADAACHSTYVVKSTLDCAPEHPDCNLGFDRCVIGPASCAATNSPACSNNPTALCTGAYVPEYGESGCVIDCVRDVLCAND